MMNFRFLFPIATACCLIVASQTNVSAQVTSYSQNFDSLTPGANVLADDGWDFFSDNAGLGAYNGDAPGEGPNISALANDGAGNQFINFFANYGNGNVHNNASLKEAISLFQQQTFTAGDAATGDTWEFNFDYAGNPDAQLTTTDVEVGAFIRVFDGSFNLLAEQNFDTFGTDTAFNSGSLSQTFDPNWNNGGIIQFGFNNLVGEFNPSGVFYDNVSFSAAAVPEPSSAIICALLGMGVIARRRR